MTTPITFPPTAVARDPVCGMLIEPKRAFASRPVGGGTMFRCSQACMVRFDAAPGRYAAAIPAAVVTPDGGSSATALDRPVGGPVLIDLPVYGLTRTGGPALQQASEAVPGVHSATVSIATGRALDGTS